MEEKKTVRLIFSGHDLMKVIRSNQHLELAQCRNDQEVESENIRSGFDPV